MSGRGKLLLLATYRQSPCRGYLSDNHPNQSRSASVTVSSSQQGYSRPVEPTIQRHENSFSSNIGAMFMAVTTLGLEQPHEKVA